MDYAIRFEVKVNGVVAQGRITVHANSLEEACEVAQEYLAWIYGDDFVKVLEVS